MKDLRFPSRGDSRWLLSYAAFLGLLTLLPYALALGNKDPNWVFTGFLFGVEDGNSYLAKMLSGASGEWLFRSPYSSMPQAGLWFVFAPYLLLGKLAGGPEIHLQLIVLFQAFRIAGTFLLVFAGYDFAAVFLPGLRARRTAVLLLTAGGGLGWMLVLFGQVGWLGSLPLDFYSPESFGFLAIFGLPHLAAGRALMLWGIVILLRALEREATGPAEGVQAGLFWLGAGIFSPINPAIAWLVTGVFVLVCILAQRGFPWKPTVRIVLIAGIISSPVVVYGLLGSSIDPYFSAWTAQNRILSPHPLHYLLAYGLFLPLAAVGGWRLFRRGVEAWFPLVWVVLVPLLAYLPYNLQRRLPEGAFAALVVLFLAGLDVRTDKVRPSGRQLTLVGLSLISTIFLLAGAVSVSLVPGQPVFRPAGEVAAFDWLAVHAAPGEVVLAPVEIGNSLPAFTPQRVVLGHGPETIGFDRLRPLVSAYFSGELDPETRAVLLARERVDYVLGPEAMAAPPGGEQVYAGQGYTIFHITR